ncbi:hypothetical protein O59_002683 [Cellvibrio sp. BR]|jgi:uncharacterized protein YehS (DUF1456 family)|uniref:DUF1456 family protein n=1 Tax=unclassified Cellvibrio TaxID=2624793 RepID=UPI000260179B|nr:MULTISPECIES: DUF1456 family protein [unclassified Cellvibrio]EIK44353.1 hypothetical protein O59_002683 [Cellvibrio sp. BR]QEY13873.1 DUF1456 family protein [Cellvibrio sp. KY-YJ-3]
MRTNDIFRKITQSLTLGNLQIQQLFALSAIDLNDKEIANLLKTDYQPGFEPMPDYVLLIFLNNLIEQQRGKKNDAEQEVIEKHAKISNNDVLKKLRIAYNLHEQQVRDALKLATIELTKSDLAALFRKPGHVHFKACDDELVLDFIEGLGLLLQQRQAGA